MLARWLAMRGVEVGQLVGDVLGELVVGQHVADVLEHAAHGAQLGRRDGHTSVARDVALARRRPSAGRSRCPPTPTRPPRVVTVVVIRSTAARTSSVCIVAWAAIASCWPTGCSTVRSVGAAGRLGRRRRRRTPRRPTTPKPASSASPWRSWPPAARPSPARWPSSRRRRRRRRRRRPGASTPATAPTAADPSRHAGGSWCVCSPCECDVPRSAAVPVLPWRPCLPTTATSWTTSPTPGSRGATPRSTWRSAWSSRTAPAGGAATSWGGRSRPSRSATAATTSATSRGSRAGSCSRAGR